MKTKNIMCMRLHTNLHLLWIKLVPAKAFAVTNLLSIFTNLELR